MSHIYNNFAYVYDKLMYDVDYKKWSDYIETIFKNYGLKSSLILDLGCGTGNFCIEMAKKGYEMIGIDISTDMLSCAKSKSEQQGVEILYLNQDMSNFELYGTVDVIVCLMDSINYLTDKRYLKRLFRLVKNYLNPGGLFIFDINSLYKFEKILGDNIFYDVSDDITYIWENAYDKRSKICKFDLTFFVRDADVYKRHDEVHFERAFSIQELKDMINYSGMQLLNTYDELSFSPASEKSKKIFFVCGKEV